jgi:hypothetical protein
MSYLNDRLPLQSGSDYERERAPVTVRRVRQDQMLAYIWFFAAAVTVVLSMAVARLMA